MRISHLTPFRTQIGYVPAWAAIVYGVLGASFANYGTKLKFLLRIDDALDIFAVHGVGGLVGNILTAFFASKSIAHLDNATVIEGGWLDQHWVQIGFQLADSFAGGTYSFVGTCLILFIMNLIPGLSLRATEEAEILGIDDAEIGEFAYDYVELTREVLNDLEDAGSRFSSTHEGVVVGQALGRDYDPREKMPPNGIPLMDVPPQHHQYATAH